MRKITFRNIFIISIVFIGLLFNKSFSQTDLPVGFSPEELQLVKSPGWNWPVTESRSVITTPPTGHLRTMAQWEEVDAVTITWTSYTSVLRDIVKAVAPSTKMYIICGTGGGGTDSTSIKTYLTSGGVPSTSIANCRFLYANYNTVWARDYGANSVYINDVDSLILVDWVYNRPRPSDDTIPHTIARYIGVPDYQTSVAPYKLINTGGNWISDGLGHSFHSNLIVLENPSMNVAQIDTVLSKFMGITRSVKLDTLPYDMIHHLDMHMKLINEETILMGQYPSGISDGPQIEANLQYILANYNSAFGTPYKVVRIPQPPDQLNGNTYPSQGGNYLTYTNALIVNKTVIVPQYYAQYDTTALRIWRGAMPGYNVVGINSNSTISAAGSLHCITHEIGPKNPLLIVHQNLPNTINTTTPYQVNARIQHRSGIQTATLYYTNDTTSGFSSVPMTFTNASLNTWTGYIPAYPAGTHVFYYIKAHANSGKEEVRPMPAPRGNFMVYVLGATGIDEYSSAFEMKPAYPNPSHGITCIPISFDRNTKGTIKLYDMLGNQVALIFDGEMIQGEKNYFINSIGISAGAYIISVETTEGRLTQKLMVR